MHQSSRGRYERQNFHSHPCHPWRCKRVEKTAGCTRRLNSHVGQKKLGRKPLEAVERAALYLVSTVIKKKKTTFAKNPLRNSSRRFPPLASGEAEQGGTMPRVETQQSGLVFSAFLEGSERFGASKPVKDPWETGSGAPETTLEHCAWSPSAHGCWARGAPERKRPQGALGGWVVAWASGQGPCGLVRTEGPRGRCVAWGRVRGWRRLVHPRVLTAWEGRLCVA